MTERPDDVETPAPGESPADPDAEDPALYDHTTPPIEASYQIRVHARRAELGEGVENDYPVPTLAEVKLFIEGAFAVGAPAFTVTVSAERIDR